MRDQRIDRRRFMKWSSASLAALGLGSTPAFLRRAMAAQSTVGKKVMFIFLRGGIDGVQTIIPYGDQGIPGQGLATYLQARPTLGVPRAQAHDINGFAGLHPSMQDDDNPEGPKLLDILRGEVDERPSNLALVHRIGYEAQNRSHFSSQQFYENAVPGAVKLEEGLFNRYISAYKNPASPLQAATMNNNQVVFMKGGTQIPVLRSIGDFALPPNVLLGTPATLDDPIGSGLMGAYTQAGFDMSKFCETLTYGTGTALMNGLRFFEENVRNTPYEPEADAQPYYAAIANRAFRGYVMDCARLLKQVDSLQVTGCNQGGYDTHGSENTRLPPLLRDLSLAYTALYHDLKPIWDDTVVVTLSEFGRTSLENGNRGTDHAEATLMMLMGGAVNGGLYNCDRDSWAHGDLFSTANGRYVAHRTDFRNVYHEIITGHLGDPDGHIDEIIPNYTATAAKDPNGYFTPLGLIG